VALAALNSFGKTEIIQEKESRNHTQIFLKKVGSKINIKKKGLKNIIQIMGKKKLNNFKLEMPGDPSSAAFFTALTILNNKSSLTLKNICLNPTRIGFYILLKKYGAKIKIKNLKKKNNEIVGNIFVKSGIIKPIKCNSSYYSKTVDEFPILFVIAALNEGTSKFSGIKNLANKESNRILEIKNLLKKINIKCKSDKNSMTIYGIKNLNVFKKKIIIDPKLDHRICQSAAILALATGINITIKNFETVNTSAPSFLKKIKQLGGKFEIKKTS
jgi:3-phosphoshikimate 1-carboxyvinyltransferase